MATPRKILKLIKTGIVITNVSGVKTLINLAKAGDLYYSELIAELLRLQKECRSIAFAKRAEEIWGVIRKAHIREFKTILEKRVPRLSNAAQKRLVRVIKKV